MVHALVDETAGERIDLAWRENRFGLERQQSEFQSIFSVGHLKGAEWRSEGVEGLMLRFLGEDE
jgi:hypothetical protein